MEVSEIDLIDKTKSSLEEVVTVLVNLKSGTNWSQQTNELAINYAKKLSEVYGDVWHKGFLPQEFLPKILLPKHWHSLKEADDCKVFFPLDTPVEKALNLIKDTQCEEAKECLKLIDHLKNEITKDGFNSSVVLAVIDGTLKPVDGLHRIIATHELIKGGYTNPTIPVFLCDSTKK